MRLLPILILCLIAFMQAPVALAAKPRMRPSANARRASATPTGYSRATLSRSANSVVVTFINLSQVKKITYTLSYTANGIEQGAIGSLAPNGAATETRSLYFGTCSHGVCTPHRGIQRATLLIETQLNTGRLHTKRYTIRY